MYGRFVTWRDELLAQARVLPEGWSWGTARLKSFVEPFVAALAEPVQRQHFIEYASELLSNLVRKTGNGIAYLLGQDRSKI